MRIAILTCSLFVTTHALFGLFDKKTTTTTQKPTTTVTTTTAPSNKNLGHEIFVPHHDETETGIIEIPLNDPKTEVHRHTIPQSTTTGRPMGGTTMAVIGRGVEVGDHFTTTAPRFKFTAATKILPSSDRHPSAKCPNRIDAFTFGPDAELAFNDDVIYIIQNNRIVETTTVAEMFPSGPKKVNGALYDLEREVMFVIDDRSVYGYKKDGGDWKLQSAYPKELPSSIAFTPDAAVRWHNKHQMLLSNGGKFALYDEYWNKSLLTGRTSQYFENLPDRVRGISEWRSGKAHVFTQSLVFSYDADEKNVVGEGVPLGDFWRC